MKEAEPRLVVLFSGHMVDRPERAAPRLPPGKILAAAEAIGRELDALAVGSDDLGICGGACGGDLLFAEAALDRGLSLELFLALAEAEFLTRSVRYAGPEWDQRFQRVTSHARTQTRKPESATSIGSDAFSRNVDRQIDAAFRWGAEKVHVVVLWDGRPGEGPGGTDDMYRAAQSLRAPIVVIDPADLREERP